MADEFRYDAFISYRHVEPDRTWAKWLHTALETYRVPPALAAVKNLPARLSRVFRDEEELPASNDLNGQIEQALRTSKTLIVICSRATPQSRWVNREVERFRELGKGDRILALLIDGEPIASFPPALREIRKTIVDASGNTIEQVEEIEPLAADVRPRANESMAHLRRMARLRLLACILGVRFDDLRQREQERRSRRLMLLSVAGAVLTLLMSALAVAAVLQRNEAHRQRAEAVRQEGIAKENARKENAARLEAQRRLAESFVAQGDLFASGSRWLESAHALDEAHKAFGESGSSVFPADLGLWQLRLSAPAPLNAAFAPQTLGRGAVALSPDGRIAIALKPDETLAAWDLFTGRIVHEFGNEGGFTNAAAFSADGKLLVTAHGDGRVRLWDTATFARLHVFEGIKGPALCVCFTADAKYIVAGGADRTVRLWESASKQSAATLTGHNNVVMSVGSAGSLVVSGDGNGEVYLWNLSTQQRRKLGSVEAPVTGVALSSDGKFAATVAGSETALWNLADGQRERTFQQPQVLAGGAKFVPESVFAKVAFAPDGQRLLRASGQYAVSQVIRGIGATRTFANHNDVVEAIATAADGALILTSSRDGRLLLWPGGEPRGSRALLHGINIYCIDISNDGALAITAGADGSVKLWDVFTGQLLKTFSYKGAAVSVAISPDNQSALIGGDDRIVHLVDLQTGKPIHELAGHENGINGVAFSPDGTRALSADKSGRVKLWDLQTGTIIHALPGHLDGAVGVAFSPDGKIGASCGVSRDVILWDLQTGREIRTLAGHTNRVRAVAISADGKQILTGSDDATMRLWDAATGEEIRSYRADPVAVCGVAFSPDGRMLFSAGATKSLRIWDAASDRQIRSLKGFEESVWSVTVSADGAICAAGGNEGIALINDFSLPKQARELSVRVTEAIEKLKTSPQDGASLAAIGEHFALSGVWSPALELLKQARAGGAEVSPLLFARVAWMAGDVKLAREEFSRIQGRNSAESTYLKLCIDALSER